MTSISKYLKYSLFIPLRVRICTFFQFQISYYEYFVDRAFCCKLYFVKLLPYSTYPIIFFVLLISSFFQLSFLSEKVQESFQYAKAIFKHLKIPQSTWITMKDVIYGNLQRIFHMFWNFEFTVHYVD